MQLTAEQIQELIQAARDEGKQLDLHGRDLSYTGLAHADLSGANLRQVTAIQSDFSEGKLRGADFSGADMRGTNFFRSDLRGADFSKAYLFQTDFSEADLQEANLSRADVSGANFEHAKLDGANLQHARYDNSTTWPITLDPGAAGAVRGT